MTDERAIEILDPEHREHYESIEPINEACRIGIAAIKRSKELEAENAQLRHRIEIVERALDKACEDIRKVIDCCWWAEKYIPEKVTPQAYIERSEKERRSEQ